MKSLMKLLECMLADASLRCDTGTRRDFLTISRRVEQEGVSFLTLTLPAFCKDFELCLATGQVDSTRFLGFRKRGSLPAFLRGLTSQVFDIDSGGLLAQPSSDAVLAVRQICLAFKKVRLPCSTFRTRRTFDGYVKIEKELRGPARVVPERLLRRFEELSRILWGEPLSAFGIRSGGWYGTPKHGPGATAEKVSSENSKYRFAQWHHRLQTFFPADGFIRPDLGAQVDNDCSTGTMGWARRPSNNGDGKGFGKDQLSGYDHLGRNPALGSLTGIEFLEPGAEPPVRVVSVPKTLKGPRIIAIEPLCMQYTQQGLLETIVSQIESVGLCVGHINFSDQQVNRDLALRASKHGCHATIDLSEASDRVPSDLVYRMLSCNPDLRDAIFACRSTRAKLPSGLTIRLRKFASMGSALCFPMESMVFITLCILGRLEMRGLRATPKSIKAALRGVYVYGDDIIVPTDAVDSAVSILETFGLKVNLAKSFWTGKFRESCGLDAFDGVEVKPTYIREKLPSSRRHVPGIVSTISSANQFYKTGWWGTAKWLRAYMDRLLGPLPHVGDDSPASGWHSYDKRYDIHRWNRDLQRPEVRAWLVTPAYREDPLDGYPALLKFFLKRGRDPRSDGHLERTVRSRSVRIKSGWAPPF